MFRSNIDSDCFGNEELLTDQYYFTFNTIVEKVLQQDPDPQDTAY